MKTHKLFQFLFGILFIIAASASTAYANDDITNQLNNYSLALKKQPKSVSTLIKRGDLYFKLHEFDMAISDYSEAIKLDPHADMAYFGRGLALGRSGYIHKGIQDLTVYIKRHPKDSHAYTKRGVRHLWLKEFSKAEQDLSKAIALDPRNAEAHDDLGVILARRKDYAQAIKNFTATVTIDPTYAKGWHNLSMVHYIVGQDILALNAINHSLHLTPEAKNSLLLKAKILHALGQTEEAKKIEDDADFLPGGNWSERVSVQ